MNVRIKWIENAMFVGESGSGHAVIMDGPKDSGGRNLGIRPMEMLLLGMGGCTAFDVVLILQKGKNQISDCQVEISAERSEEIPKVFTKLHVHFKVFGKNLKNNVVDRAIKLSSEKYCSASIMLDQVAKITHDFEIINSEN
ncbi:MAG: OsmC family protein [Methylococcales bacterium]|nr:OsmC family protein [Methylococcales bacterium]MBT7410454.1 OsmC family protein [Methylococcales bacterium]